MAGVELLVALALAGKPRFEASWLHRAAQVAGFHVAGSNDAAWFVGTALVRVGSMVPRQRGSVRRAP